VRATRFEKDDAKMLCPRQTCRSPTLDAVYESVTQIESHGEEVRSNRAGLPRHPAGDLRPLVGVGLDGGSRAKDISGIADARLASYGN